MQVVRDPNDINRGSGLSHFLLLRKQTELKSLYVALAQRKEDRRARLQAQSSQIRPIAMVPNVRMPFYPPGGSGLGQQIFYGQGPPALIYQPGFGYQQEIVPGMRPAACRIPEFFVPMVQQGHPAQRPGRCAGAGPVHPNQPPVPLMQQQMAPRGGGRVYHLPPGRNMTEVPMGPGGMLYDMGSMCLGEAPMSQPIPIGALASALANASPDQQRTMLGESLYRLIDQIEHDSVATVTSMHLEIDQTEVLHFLESPDALNAKVAEAMEVLRCIAQQQQGGAPTDQLQALPLSDNLVS